MNTKQDLITVFLTALLSDSDLIQTLTGESYRDAEPSILDGYDLVIQKIDQIPETPQRIIRGTWGEDFESYNLTPGLGSIKGIKCRITEDQWARLDDWEFGEFGWFVPKEVEVRNPCTGKLERVMTIVMGEGQSFERKVDGFNFSPYLMPREKTLEVAEKARQIYNERYGIIPEGNFLPGKESKF